MITGMTNDLRNHSQLKKEKFIHNRVFLTQILNALRNKLFFIT